MQKHLWTRPSLGPWNLRISALFRSRRSGEYLAGRRLLYGFGREAAETAAAMPRTCAELMFEAW